MNAITVDGVVVLAFMMATAALGTEAGPVAYGLTTCRIIAAAETASRPGRVGRVPADGERHPVLGR